MAKNKVIEGCQAETRQMQTGASWASTTWTCPNKASKTYEGPRIVGRLRVCGTHYNMLVRDYGESRA